MQSESRTRDCWLEEEEEEEDWTRMLFHEYLFQLRDELNTKTEKWSSKQIEDEIRNANSVQDYNKFVR